MGELCNMICVILPLFPVPGDSFSFGNIQCSELILCDLLLENKPLGILIKVSKDHRLIFMHLDSLLPLLENILLSILLSVAGFRKKDFFDKFTKIESSSDSSSS